jgi:hypothetical protein
MANLAVCDNIFIDFNSHNLSKSNKLFKDYASRGIYFQIKNKRKIQSGVLENER